MTNEDDKTPAGALKRLQQVLRDVEAGKSTTAAKLPAAPAYVRSNAPRPLEPVRGSAGGPRRSTAPVPVRWPLWRALPKVELWQAVALSLDIEPADSMRDNVRQGQSTRGLSADFFDRLRVCQQAVTLDGPIRPKSGLYFGTSSYPGCGVLLAEVADFLAGAEFELPEEMCALVPVPAEPAPTPTAPAREAAGLPTKASQAAVKEAREDARLAHCEAEGLVFDKDPLRPLPYGITKAAESLDPPITRQSLSTDVKAALRRRFERARNGRG